MMKSNLKSWCSTKRAGFKLAALLAIAALASPDGWSQAFSGDWNVELTKDRPAEKSSAEKAVEAQILEFQAELRKVSATRDLPAIRRFFADDYTMTHGAGMVDNADGRAKWIADGVRSAFETMPIAHQSIRVLAPTAAVAVLNSRYSMQGRTGTIRYMIVYSRGEANQGYQGWRMVTALVNNIPDSR